MRTLGAHDLGHRARRCRGRHHRQRPQGHVGQCHLGSGGDPQHIADVEVSAGLARVIDDRVAREAGPGGQCQQVGRVVGQPQDFDLVGGDHKFGRRDRPQPERACSQLRLTVIQQTLTTGFRDQGRHLVGGEGGGDLVARGDPQDPQTQVGHAVQHRDHGAQHPRDPPQGRRQPQRSALGRTQREVLGHHLTDDDVKVDHDQQGDDEGDRVCRARGQTHGQDDGLDQLRQRRFRNRPQSDRTDRDPQLRTGEHQGHALHPPQRRSGPPAAGLRQRFDLAAARRDDGEFGSHEERVAQQQGHAQPDPGRHGAPNGVAVKVSIR